MRTAKRFTRSPAFLPAAALAAVLLAAVMTSPARADDLVIVANGVETYYPGEFSFVETEGLSGRVEFNATGTPIVSPNTETPAIAGLWQITVRTSFARGAKTKAIEFVGTCYGTTAFTLPNHGGRVRVVCAAAQ